MEKTGEKSSSSYLDLFGINEHFGTQSKAHNCQEHSRVILKSDQKCCVHRTESWTQLFSTLVWPFFCILVLFSFKDKFSEILKNIAELISRIKYFDSKYIKFLTQPENKILSELKQDIEDVKKELHKDSSEIVSDVIKDEYSSYISKTAYERLKNESHIKSKALEFENTAISLLESDIHKSIKRNIRARIGLDVLDIDGYFIFEKDFYLIEVKFVKQISSALISRLLNKRYMLEKYSSTLSNYIGEDIRGQKLIVLFPHDCIIPALPKKIIKDNDIWVYLVNYEDHSLKKYD